MLITLRSRLNHFVFLYIFALSAGLVLGASSGNAFAVGTADVIKVDVRRTSPQTWHFSVTVLHQDSGWEKYADGWDVVLPDGTVVKPAPNEEFTRTLWHPHVNEQPFTRSQGGIIIPAAIKSVTVRAHVKPDGFGGKEILVDVSH